jgi:hypothetical protein
LNDLRELDDAGHDGASYASKRHPTVYASPPSSTESLNFARSQIDFQLEGPGSAMDRVFEVEPIATRQQNGPEAGRGRTTDPAAIDFGDEAASGRIIARCATAPPAGGRP